MGMAAEQWWRLRGQPQRLVENSLGFTFPASDVQGRQEIGDDVIEASHVVARCQLLPRPLEQFESFAKSGLIAGRDYPGKSDTLPREDGFEHHVRHGG
jgi:hypothetical protein